jgi:hypothetical protein
VFKSTTHSFLRTSIRATRDDNNVVERLPDSSFSKDDENIINSRLSRDVTVLSKEIVDALDLTPVIENVMMHAATRRARDALLSLVVDDSSSSSELLPSNRRSSWERQRQSSTRKDILTSISNKSLTGEIFQKRIRDNRKNSSRRLIRVATTLKEARDEWGFILEASNILSGHQPGRLMTSEEEIIVLPLPPIYGRQSSPWDIHQDEADSDDDEWLQGILVGVAGGYATATATAGSSLELENILQAEQVVKRIVQCYEWSQREDIKTQVPRLCDIFQGIPVEDLKKVLEEIEGGVIVTSRGKAGFSDSLNANVSTMCAFLVFNSSMFWSFQSSCHDSYFVI